MYSLEFKTGSHNNHRRNLIVTCLLVVVLVTSLFVYVLVVNNNAGVVHVKNEVELEAAIKAVEVGGSAIIVFDNDIETNLQITISPLKNITLTSNGNNQFKLIGGTGATTYTITVMSDGVLVIDGICVTRVDGAVGGGVYNFGNFTMCSGEISGNVGVGGVYNMGGVFTMTGGKIINNTAYAFGGGVLNNGVFTMTGGEITGNIATTHGGGVHNNGIFNRCGGEISDNIANTGKNVYYFR